MIKKKKAVIFGGAGFLGKHVAIQLAKKGYDVWIFDIMPPNENLGEEINFVLGNVLETEKVNEIIKGAEVVYNFAGIADIEECLKKPLDAIKINILGNSIILEACKKTKVHRYIFASSLYAQGISGGIYSSTKKACENIIKNYKKYYNLNYTILQYGTVYGYGAPKTNSIYRYLKQAFFEKKIDYPGDGTETREYIHVLDAAKLTAKIMEKEYENKTIIITGNYPTKIKDLFNMVKDILGEIKINYNIKVSKEKKESHYKITPYSYLEEIPKKMTSNIQMELGRGIIEVLKEISKEKNKSEKSEKPEDKKIKKYCFPEEEKTIGIDFDGVIHDANKGFHDGTIYGNPIKGVHSALKELSKNYALVIYTAKAKPDRPLINGKTGKELILEWLKKHKLEKYVKEITSEKPRAIFYIDDRSINFTTWEEAIKQIKNYRKNLFSN